MTTSEVYVEIRADIGLYIEGSVLGVDGAPAPKVGVSARADEIRAWLWAQSDDAGRFRVGPMSAGTWKLAAGGMGDTYARSEPVAIEAGTLDAVLHVRPGASLEGRVITSAGVVVNDPEIMCTRTDATSARGMTSQRDSDTFRITGLPGGTYLLAARARDGEFGAIDGIVVAEGQKVEGLIITTQPAERLTIRNGEDTPVNVLLEWRGGYIGGDGIAAKDELRFVVPPAELTIEARWPGETEPRAQAVTIARGETKEVVLTRSP